MDMILAIGHNQNIARKPRCGNRGYRKVELFGCAGDRVQCLGLCLVKRKVLVNIGPLPLVNQFLLSCQVSLQVPVVEFLVLRVVPYIPDSGVAYLGGLLVVGQVRMAGAVLLYRGGIGVCRAER